VHGDGRGMGQNGAHLVRWLFAEAAPQAGWTGGGGAWGRRRSGVQEGGGSVVAVRGEPGSCRPLFIGAGRRLGG
jgi:hypothetical protein